MGPVVLIGALFTVREVAALWAERHAISRAAVTAVAIATAVVALVTVSSGAFRVAEHTSVVSGTEQLADFVSSYASGRPDQPVRLYFPTSQAYRIMNFASYLHYRHGNSPQNVTFA